ncbi:DUF1501 domain-containing protein [Mycobacterium sp.]|uniref:DUF1501 domain-containing protein n=1 Tax=Mycobacterium sp. TaxID=1785 RepID=UPI00333E75CD
MSLGDFDTHADERAAHRSLLKALDDALTRFLHEMRSSSFGKNVVVMVWSEFGRRVAGERVCGHRPRHLGAGVHSGRACHGRLLRRRTESDRPRRR